MENYSERVDKRKYGGRCVINFCKRSYRNDFGQSQVRLFKFPKDEINRSFWISKCKLSADIDVNKARICNLHFEKKYFGKKKLKSNAIPTLHLFEEEQNISLSFPSCSYEFKEDSEIFDKEASPKSNDSELEDISNFLQFNCEQKQELWKDLSIDAKENSNKDIKQVLPEVSSRELGVNLNVENTEVNTNENTGDFCNYCLKKERNELFYRKKYTETLNLYKKEVKKNKNQKAEIHRLKVSIKRQKERKKKSIKIVKNKVNKIGIEEFIDNMSGVSENSKTFSKMLLKNKKVWKENEKCIAQSINFYSAKAYNYMRQNLGLNLPSKSSLCRWAPIKFLKPGMNNTLLNNLRKVFENMDTKSREAILLYDEISIKKGLQYNSHEDEIQGFVDDGTNKELELCKQICVFMLRGLHSNWKLIVSYYASSTGIKADNLKELVKENLEAAETIGLNVRGIVSDQSSNNRSCFNKLSLTAESPYFVFNSIKIYGFYDVPHLIKSLRNTWIKDDMERVS